METSLKIITAARSWIGTHYRHQASLKGVGCDCLGLVRGVWRECVGDEPEVAPPYSADWAEASGVEALAEAGMRHLIGVEDLQFEAGDVLLFRWKAHVPAKHAAIAVSHDAMIHAQEGHAVAEVPLSRWWRQRLAYVFRFPTVN